MYDNSTPNNGQASSVGSFDIRDHLDKLDPGKGKNCYTCPVCKGRRLSVNPKSSAYQCWSGGCSTNSIREAIRPLAEFLAKREGEQPVRQARKPKAQKKEYTPAPVPIGAKILRLPEPGKPPRAERPIYFPKDVPCNATQITYTYSSTQKVLRFEWSDANTPKGRGKTCRQVHIDPIGKEVWSKGDARWPAYRIDEVVELLKSVPDSEPIIVPMLEGEDNVERARGIGITGLTLQGSDWSDPETQKMLEALRATGKNIVVAVLRDNDDAGIKKGQGVWLVASHIQFPCTVIDPCAVYPNIPEAGDIREILEAIDSEEFIRRVEEEVSNVAAQSESDSIEPRVSTDNKPPTKSKNKWLLDLVETHWGERLRFNEMTQQVELSGIAGELDIERVYLRLADELGIDIPKQTASDLVVVTAKKNAYSPVRNYLNSLTDIEPINLDSLAERYFGTNDPLHAKMFKYTLVAAVARVYVPGCKVDTLCILQGIQGLFKSLLWQKLTGEAWFTDNLSEANEKDEKLKLRRYWMLEFSEFETAYKRKDIDQLKSFLSSRIDSLRRPYGRSIEDFPRTSIFVGTTNRQEILHDPTGGRRYWVIPVQQRIPIETVEAERDAVWAAAAAAYKSGEQWWLTLEEDKLLAETNKDWQASDTWEASILSYLQDKSTTTVSELLIKVIGLDLAQQKKAEQMRASDILRCNGWMRYRKRIEGKPQWCWAKVGTEVGTPPNPLPERVSNTVLPHTLNEVGTEVGTPQNPYSETILETVFSPVPTFSLKHSGNTNDIEVNRAIVLDENGDYKSEESFENRGGNTSPDNTQNLLEQGLEGVPTSPERGGNTSSSTGAKPPKRIFEEGDRVVIVEVGSLHEGQHGEILHVGHGSRDIDYTVKLDKESHGNQRVTVSVPHGSKLTFLLREKL